MAQTIEKPHPNTLGPMAQPNESTRLSSVFCKIPQNMANMIGIPNSMRPYGLIVPPLRSPQNKPHLHLFMALRLSYQQCWGSFPFILQLRHACLSPNPFKNARPCQKIETNSDTLVRTMWKQCSNVVRLFFISNTKT